jgi:fimbrial isopeptide formation D2 family protein
VQSDTVDFALVKKGDINDLAIDLLPTNGARPGFLTHYALKYRNKGTVAVANTSVQFVLDPRTDFYSASVPYTSRNGDTLSWNTGDLDPLVSSEIDITLAVKAPPVTNVHDSLAFSAFVLPVTGDATPQNNQARIKQAVFGSYDPNDKIEVHGNYLPLQLAQNNEYLTYVIRFQNTGNAVAYNVDVRDTLDNKLDWNSFEMIGSSHSYQLSIADGNKLEWAFKNIFLPDSNSNEPGSHGYIAYRVKPKQGLNAGDSIVNKASIYFDFNLPVATNIAQTNLFQLAALPATLLRFDGKWTDTREVLLNWNVTNETSVSGYLVDRSDNGYTFSYIGRVSALNNGSITGYSFTDKQPLDNISYYRLRIVDVDGKTSYSPVIKLNKSLPGSGTGMQVYPSPAVGKVYITLLNETSGPGILKIVDAFGKQVYYKPMAYIGSNGFELPFDFKNQPGGLYYIQVQRGDHTYRGTVIKQ